ncbi:MucBP domain-containing protein [Enterococcus faecalis]
MKMKNVISPLICGVFLFNIGSPAVLASASTKQINKDDYTDRISPTQELNSPLEVDTDDQILKASGGSITVKYEDDQGNTLSDEIILSGNVGNNYTTELKDIPDYLFVDVYVYNTENQLLDQKYIIGEFTLEPIKIVYTYIKDEGRGEEDQGETVVRDSILSIGDTWNPEDNFVRATNEDGDSVNFLNMHLSFLGGYDLEGNPVDKVDTSKPGTYKVLYSQNNYYLSESIAEFNAEKRGIYQAIATITVKPSEVEGTVVSRYVDEYNNEIETSSILTGLVGSEYTTTKKNITGYTFKEVQGNVNGSFTEEPQSVTYIYTKDPVKAANITVNYQDESGNAISDVVILSGNVGDSYESEQKTITGYTFKEVQGNKGGFFTAEDQTVTYIYTKNENPVTPTGSDSINPSISGNVTTDIDVSENFNVSKIKSERFPNTGENSSIWIAILGSLIIFTITFFYIFKTKKSK